MAIGDYIWLRENNYTRIDPVNIPIQYECLNCGFDTFSNVECEICNSKHLSITQSLSIVYIKWIN